MLIMQLLRDNLTLWMSDTTETAENGTIKEWKRPIIKYKRLSSFILFLKMWPTKGFRFSRQIFKILMQLSPCERSKWSKRTCVASKEV